MSIFICKHTETLNTHPPTQHNGMLIYFVYNHYDVHEQQLFNFHHYFDNKFSSWLLLLLFHSKRGSESVRQMVDRYEKKL